MSEGTKVKERIQKVNLGSLISEDAFTRMKVIEILNRAGKYVQGYLPDFSIDLEKDFTGDPLTITIKVHIKTPEEVKENHDVLASQ